MRFEWDEVKRLAVLAERGLDFVDVCDLFDGRPILTVAVPRSGENRWLSVGKLRCGRSAVRQYESSRLGGLGVTKAGGIARRSGKQAKAVRKKSASATNWSKVDEMTEAELEASIAADPDDVHERLDWTRAVIGIPPRKQPIKLRIDADVLDWFRSRGRGYQTLMNNVLRKFFESRSRRP